MISMKNLSVILFFVMFLYSGINKFSGFTKKVDTLEKKTGLPHTINQLGMIGVILLEIIGSLIIIVYNLQQKSIISKELLTVTKGAFLLFLIVVTALYHPPGKKKMIPFLSNLTTFGGLLYMFSDK